MLPGVLLELPVWLDCVRRADLVSTDLVKGSSLAETLPLYERHGRVSERSNKIVESTNRVKE